MAEPTKDQIAAAISTPIRDLRDEVWVRVYAAEFCSTPSAKAAAMKADNAVAFMPIPAHRRRDAGL